MRSCMGISCSMRVSSNASGLLRAASSRRMPNWRMSTRRANGSLPGNSHCLIRIRSLTEHVRRFAGSLTCTVTCEPAASLTTVGGLLTIARHAYRGVYNNPQLRGAMDVNSFKGPILPVRPFLSTMDYQALMSSTVAPRARRSQHARRRVPAEYRRRRYCEWPSQDS